MYDRLAEGLMMGFVPRQMCGFGWIIFGRCEGVSYSACSVGFITSLVLYELMDSISL